MRIAVFIKQVPATTEVEIDSETGVLKRGLAKGKLNPFDLFAIESALEIREVYGGTVTALTMGPLSAKQSLLEAVYMGADDACILSGAQFAGSDVLATSRALAGAVCTLEGFDLIICGKQTTDGDTAQVGAQTAEWLGIPHVTGVVSVISAEEGALTVGVETEDFRQTVNLPLPCLICMDKNINTPRLPSFLRKKNNSELVIREIRLGDLADTDENSYGIEGSPTRVVRIFEPEPNNKSERLEGEAQDVARKLFEMLSSERMI